MSSRWSNDSRRPGAQQPYDYPPSYGQHPQQGFSGGWGGGGWQQPAQQGGWDQAQWHGQGAINPAFFPPPHYPPPAPDFGPYNTPYHAHSSASHGWAPNPAAPPFQPSPAGPSFQSSAYNDYGQPWQPRGHVEAAHGGGGGGYGGNGYAGGSGSWGGGGGGGWGGHDDRNGGGRRGRDEPDPWSTGDYRPRRERDDRDYRSSSRRSASPPSSRFDRGAPPPPDRHRPYDRPQHQRFRSRSPSPAPYAPVPDQGYVVGEGGGATYGPNGEYIAPERRKKKDVRTGAVAGPVQSYLAASAPVEGGSGGEKEPELPTEYEPPLVILDLNHTLLCRAKRTSWGSRQPLVRPYLSTFLEYLCSSEPAASSAEARRPRFLPVVYSSARAPNVLSMLAALSLIPPARFAALPPPSTFTSHTPFSPPPYLPSREEGDVLTMVFTREMMGLNGRDYAGDVETTKDLARVWEELGWGGLREWKLHAKEEAAAEAASATEEGKMQEVYEAKDGENEGEGEGEIEGEADEVDAAGQPSKKRKKRPNRKHKARFDRERDEIGARRTVLLDDEASKAVQQPYNHLSIHPFIVPPQSFPPPVLAPPPPAPAPSTDPSASSSPFQLSRPPLPAFVPPPLAALEVPSSHPAAKDSHLLGAIYLLERLRGEKSIARSIRGGLLEKIREEAKEELKVVASGEGKEPTYEEVDEALAQKGREVCERLGIEVRERWEPEWRERVLEKEKEGR
ncbi:hypothetical protein JCM8097_008193 [Rhodosporidiobolus ruineniae]